MIRYRTLDIEGIWGRLESLEFDAGLYIQRFRINDILKRLDLPLIEVILGPRQSGKTTLLFMIISELLSRNIVPEQIFYINMDTIIPTEQFKNPMLLVRQLADQGLAGERAYLFIDEVQRLEYPGRFLKGVYDLGKDIKIVVSGSSSLEIKAKIKESLAGRKRETYLLPLSFREYVLHGKRLPPTLNHVELDRSSVGQWVENEALYGRYLRNRMEEVAVFGGYPGVLKQQKREERLEELSEIHTSYVKRDIIEFLNMEKPARINQLIKVLAGQVGNLMNKSEIASLTGTNTVTLSKYLNILQETYVTAYLPPLVSNRRNEIKRAHKCFFLDNGFRNLSISQFNSLGDRTDKGPLLENMVFSELLKHRTLDQGIRFWRTKAGSEVDFVISREQEDIPVEIKAGPARPGRLSKSFHAFLDHFSPKKGLFLNRDLFHVTDIKQTRVYYIPIHWFLFSGLEMILGVEGRTSHFHILLAKST